MRGDGGIGVEPGIAAHPDITLRSVAPRETWPLQEPAAARAALRTQSRLDEDWSPVAVVDVLRSMPTLGDTFEEYMVANPNRSKRTNELYR